MQEGGVTTTLGRLVGGTQPMNNSTWNLLEGCGQKIPFKFIWFVFTENA